MKKKFFRTESLRDVPMHYCPGCGHGILHHYIARAIDELGLRQQTIGVAPVGCAVVAYDYWNFDVSEAAHGRPLAVATGIKRCQPDKLVFTYQGDGDLASIGLAETIHTANRGENISCIFVNNAGYGMTGGQMAPTTLPGQKTATTPQGRNPQGGDGWPLRISEMIAGLDGVDYVARTSLSSPAARKNTLDCIKEAFKRQREKRGFCLVEVLSPCPTVWRKDPLDSLRWIEQEMARHFPLGIIKKRQ